MPAQHSHHHAGMPWSGLLAALLTALLCGVFAAMLPAVQAGDTLIRSWPWAPSLGLHFSLLVDGLSLTFALLITGIGAVIMLYASRYLAGHPQFHRFILYLFSFMLAMLGLVLADNLLTLFVFWELTTFTSFLLIGFAHADERARRNANQALLITAAGGLALLAGFVLIGITAGTFELSEINTRGDLLTGSPLYVPILVLVLIGAFTKSAQLPFHIWLPNAMSAPTPVSAYLHSATMVKAGIYLLARMHPSLSGSDIWLWTLTGVGGATAVFAAFMAIRHTDLKTSLAYTTLAALGALTLFLGPADGYAITGAVTFLIVHSLYKAALFMTVGIIDHQTGTRELGRLGGLARTMPITATIAVLAAASMAGFPPFVGFIGKELKYAGALAVWSEPAFIIALVVLANALVFAVAGIIALKPFFGKAAAPTTSLGEAPLTLLIGPMLLALLGVGFGIMPGLLADSLITPAVNAILGSPGEAAEVQLWAGFNVPLLLSIVTVAAGAMFYLYSARLRGLLGAAERRLPDLDAGWDRLLSGFVVMAGALTRLIQPGILRHYLFATFAVAALAVAIPGLTGDLFTRATFEVPPMPPKYWLLAGLTVAGALLVALTGSRTAAIAGLGVVGVGVALVFVVFGAIDVAITQLLVEVLVVAFVAVAALRMPFLDPPGGVRHRPGDAVLAIMVGTVVTGLMLLVTAGPLDRSITDFYEAASWPEAYGRNVVNVILVDFRALDTFGEIVVVAIAAIAAHALLKGRRTLGKLEERA